MKTFINIAITFIVSSTAIFAQPISGFMGKRFATSLELEVVPGFQGDYEPNTSKFLGFYSPNGYSYVPRLLGNVEYQIKQKLSLSGAVGYAGMHVPIYFLVPNIYGYLDTYKTVQKLNTVFLQVGFKHGLRKASMPTASSYFAYRLGFYSIAMNDFGVGKTTTSQLTLNLELGKRVVFNNGIFLDYGMALNISESLFYQFRDEYNYELIGDAGYLKKAMQGRLAYNSLFNFKIALGLFY